VEYPHQPVLVHTVVKCMVSVPGGTYVDGTVGLGGHSLAIGKSLTKKGRLICLDRDPEAISISKKRLAFLGDAVCVIKANFSDLDKVLKDLEIERIDGVFLDIGMSSYQIEQSGRGFSFQREEPLDMRMDPSGEMTAGNLVNNLPLEELEGILRNYGEEKRAKLIARAIVRGRRKKPIETSFQLGALIKSVFPPSHRFKARHPATKTFQALRIAVNKELQNLDTFLDKIPLIISKGGKLVIISYHSLEDRQVKHAMFNWEKGCTCPPDLPICVCGKVPLFRRLVKKGLKPSRQEIEKNPRARSAVMRVAERI